MLSKVLFPSVYDYNVESPLFLLSLYSSSKHFSILKVHSLERANMLDSNDIRVIFVSIHKANSIPLLPYEGGTPERLMYIDLYMYRYSNTRCSTFCNVYVDSKMVTC